MTSSSRRNCPHRGFTLVELLVVIGIIVLLISILLPMVNRVYRESVRTAMAADLQVIGEALDAYRHDFGDYPRPSSQADGAEILCWALVAPGPATGPGSDGHDGPGFTLRGPGDVKGPYLPADRFRIGTFKATDGTVVTPNVFNDTQDVLADRYGRPILYYAANNGVSPNTAFVGTYTVGKFPATAVFNYNDNSRYTVKNGTSPFPSQLTPHMMEWRLGNTSRSGAIANGETPVTTGPYLLWSAGPDSTFGTDDDVANVPLNGPLPAGLTP